MNQEDILKYCLSNLKDVFLVESYGEQALFYNPDQRLKRGIYILTIKDKDGPNDKASDLNRDGVYRLNIGIRKTTFQTLFKELPKRPKAAEVVNMEYDYTVLNQILPHPVYAWMGWISILNPENIKEIEPYILEAYAYAKEKFGGKK